MSVEVSVWDMLAGLFWACVAWVGLAGPPADAPEPTPSPTVSPE